MFFLRGVAIAIVVVLTAVFSVNLRVAPILGDLTFSKLLTALGGILVIVLLVERATEIVITVFRQPHTEELQSDIDALKKGAAIAAPAPPAVPAGAPAVPPPVPAVPGVAAPPPPLNAIDAKEKELAKYQSETKGIALLFGFTLGVAACSAGIGLLGAIVDVAQGHQHFLRGIDIILTSALIAGGSDGFHQFVTTLGTFFDESKKRMEAKP